MLKLPWKSPVNKPAPLSPAGYIINHPSGRIGTNGLTFNYVTAGNGLHIEAQTPLIAARSPMATAHIAGLPPLPEALHLPYGPIPSRLFLAGLSWQKASPYQERYFAIIVRDDQYELNIPQQTGAAISLAYTPPDNAVAEFHSHGPLDAFFSCTDDMDEQGFKIYGVIGHTPNRVPQLALRIGIYGTFREISWQQVFSERTRSINVVPHNR